MKVAVQIPILLWLSAGLVHAAGPIYSAVLGGSGQDYATAVASDAQGNTYVVGLTYSSDFPVTPGAVQTTFGGTCDAFVAKLGPDGKVIWATYLGGILDDWATGVAVDSAGNVLVAGYTRSANFPLANATQSTLDQGASDGFDAFVAKLDPTGKQLLYSTFLGGTYDDGAAGIATDAAGNEYVAVTTGSAAGFPGLQGAPDLSGVVVTELNPQGGLVYSFFHPNGSAGAIAVDGAGSAYVTGTSNSSEPATATQSFGPAGNTQAMAFKVSPDGSRKVYETSLGGSVGSSGAAIAVNGAGEAYVAGSTSSVDFPLVNPFQSTLGARPLWKSADGGATWAPMDGLPFAQPEQLVVDPTNPTTLYALTADLGIFKSTDAGATWTSANSGLGCTYMETLTVDPVHPQTLYASTALYSATGLACGSTAMPVYKSMDGGATWNAVDSPTFLVFRIAVDAQNPSTVYEIGSFIRKSTDGGATWNALAFPGEVEGMALDPRVSGRVYAASAMAICGPTCCAPNPNCGYFQPPALYRSDDGGADWIQIPSVTPGELESYSEVIVDPSANPSTVYIGLGWRSDDGGVTWLAINPPPGPASDYNSLAVDGGGTLYATEQYNGLMFASHDRARTWTALNSFIPPPTPEASGPSILNLAPAGATGTLYATISQMATSGFVTKLSADGSSIVYSTYLGGHASMQPFSTYAAEPGVFQTQNWISGIALDAAGNATVAGGTRSIDFPTIGPAQAANAGGADAFVATISADGGRLTYSTYFGGSKDDGALAVTLDAQGNPIFAGQTWSNDFPVPGGLQPPYGYGEAFVVKLAAPEPPQPPVIASVLNAASLQPGIQAGSWVTIRGTNLANTSPGRNPTAAEMANGSLPTSLDGVSVTIDGQPAFVDYISPTQINVQAPADSATGPVAVVVANNGQASAAATAQLQAVAPAFFVYSGTNYAVASRLSDGAAVGDPSAVPGAVAAKPGDTLVLLGTGFGATNPPVPAGSTVSGAAAVVTAPTVTVGGMAVQVTGADIAAGNAALYQVTIQLPATAPTGAVAVEASVGGVESPGGVLLFVGKP